MRHSKRCTDKANWIAELNNMYKAILNRASLKERIKQINSISPIVNTTIKLPNSYKISFNKDICKTLLDGRISKLYNIIHKFLKYISLGA